MIKIKINSIRKVNDKESKTLGIASVILDDNSIINDIKIIKGDNGLFIAFPTPEPFSGKDYNDMTEKEQQKYKKYREKIEGMDILVIDEFNKLKDSDNNI